MPRESWECRIHYRESGGGEEVQGEVQGLPQPSHMTITVSYAASRDCKSMKQLHSFRLSLFLLRFDVAQRNGPASCVPLVWLQEVALLSGQTRVEPNWPKSLSRISILALLP